MSDLRKAAEMALKYFEGAYGLEDMEFKIKEALRTALAQGVVQEIKPYDDGLKPNYYTEPEKWVKHDPVAWWDPKLGVFDEKHFDQLQPLYTAPLKRELVGLTDEEIEDEWQSLMAKYIEEVDSSYWGRCDFEFARAIEAKLKEKNT